MTRPHGMTIAELKGIIEDMREVYSFDDDQTKITNMIDPRMGPEYICCLEVTTFDKKTGVNITMQKGLGVIEE